MPTDLETTTNNEPASDESPVIKDLRSKANRTDAAESRAQELERELVVHKAGLTDLTDKQLKALQAAHDGDWEPEALKATASELGFGKPPSGQATSEPQIPADELEAHRRVAAAANGEPPEPPQTDEALTAAIAAATSPEEIKTILRNAGRLREGD